MSDVVARSVPHPDHLPDCKRFPTGWLCNAACAVPASECVLPSGSDHPEDGPRWVTERQGAEYGCGVVWRDRANLYAFRGRDDRWHIDWRDATNPNAATGQSFCEAGGRLLLPDIKSADSIRESDLCVKCWAWADAPIPPGSDEVSR